MTNHTDLLKTSSIAFLIASFSAFCMIVLMFTKPDGASAIAAMSGNTDAVSSVESIKIMLALDLILPVGYAAGFILLALGKSSEDTSPFLLGLAVLCIVSGACLDFIEDGFVADRLIRANDTAGSVSMAKFGMLTLGGFLISVLLAPQTMAGRIAVPVLRYVTPVSIALIVGQFGGESAVPVFIFGLLGSFLFFSLVALSEARALSR